MVEEAKRRTYPSINPLRPFIVTELKKRKMGSKAVPSPTISPFVRMTSGIEDENEKYRWFSLGLHGVSDQDLTGNIFELTYGHHDIVGFGYDSTGFSTIITSVPTGEDQPTFTSDSSERRSRKKPIQSNQSTRTQNKIPAEGRHPIPGITNVVVSYKGINDVISAEVSWKCYNIVQLDFLRNHFLLAGQYVVIEYGHIISNRIHTEPIKPFDFASGDALSLLAKYELGGRLSITDGDPNQNLRGLSKDNNGNYDMVIGKIVGSEITLLPDNTYECKTNIVSVGEVIYGITNHSLISEMRGENVDSYSDTMEEFFEAGGPLDAMIGEYASRQLTDNITDAAGQPVLVDAAKIKTAETPPRFHSEDETLAEAQSNETARRTPRGVADQDVYVSWNFFTHEIISEMFSFIDNQQVNSEIELFLNIGQPIFGTENETVGESLIGNNPYLLSIDPDILILITNKVIQLLNEEGESNLFDGAQIFSNGIDQHSGYLSRGVYLNVESIKQAFSTTKTFFDGMAALLRKMNGATAYYWKLDIGFDEETRKIYIFDRGTVTQDLENVPEIYNFNADTKGELINFTFDASYTDEVKTSIMLSAYLPEGHSFDGVTVAGDYSTAVGPGIHGQVLNSSPLKDILQNEINSQILAKKQRRKSALHYRSNQVSAARLQARARTNISREREIREAEDAKQKELAKVFDGISKVLQPYIAVPSAMKALIKLDGLQNSQTVNNYLSPLATEISMDLSIMGISGIAFWDCFQVDKIPAVYTEHGVFLVNGISHSIDRGGWFTSLHGLYYFMWRDKNQGSVVQSQNAIIDIENTQPAQELTVLQWNNQRQREIDNRKEQLRQRDIDSFNTAPNR